jgi:rhodanese-related sulfurtransferase
MGDCKSGIRKVLAVVLLLALAPGAKASEQGLQNVGTAELEVLIERGVKVVDVRTRSEWRETGVIQGSWLITAFDGRGRLNSHFLSAFQAAVDRDEEVVIIDWQGGRSSMVAQMLSEIAGYRRVYNAAAGIKNWIKIHNPVAACCEWSTSEVGTY